MKFIGKLILTVLVLHSFNMTEAGAQCNPVAGSSGVVWDTNQNDSVSFSVTLSSTCSFTNLGMFTGVCGITFPGAIAPWSGNTNDSISTITYSFSKPITSVDVMIGYTGVNGTIAPETFLFMTDTDTPVVSVNSGTCIPWIINGNETTSPNVTGGLNSIHTLSTSIPFTSFTVTTNSLGTGPGANGGSSFALCDLDIATGISSIHSDNKINIHPNPAPEQIYLNGISRRINLVISDAAGRIAYTIEYVPGESIPVSDLDQGIYLIRAESPDGGIYTGRFIKL